MPEVTHIVLVEWRADVTQDVRESVRATARGLADRIPGILTVVEGPSTSPEGLEQGFEWALAISFDGPEARDGYLPHPAHLPLAALIGDNAARVVVYDLGG
jgi:hypothetical protein